MRKVASNIVRRFQANMLYKLSADDKPIANKLNGFASYRPGIAQAATPRFKMPPKQAPSPAATPRLQPDNGARPNTGAQTNFGAQQKDYGTQDHQYSTWDKAKAIGEQAINFSMGATNPGTWVLPGVRRTMSEAGKWAIGSLGRLFRSSGGNGAHLGNMNSFNRINGR